MQGIEKYNQHVVSYWIQDNGMTANDIALLALEKFQNDSSFRNEFLFVCRYLSFSLLGRISQYFHFFAPFNSSREFEERL